MSREELLYLAPYAVALVVLGALCVYALRHRYVRGVRTFAWLMAGYFLTTIGFMLELVSSELKTKLLWDTFQWLASAFLVVLPLLIFAFRFSGYRLRSISFILGIVLTFLGLFATFILTDNIHHLFYQNTRLLREGPLWSLSYGVTPALFLYLLLYAYGASLYALVLLVRHAFRPHNIFRFGDLTIAIGLSLPLVASLLPLANIQFVPQRDVTPLASAVGSLLAAWGLFRYGLFDIAPMAREQLMQELPDPVIVLDPRNRIVDANQAALIFLGQQKSAVIGRTPEAAFQSWPSLMEAIQNPFLQKKEISATQDGKTLLFEIHVSPLLGQRRESIGRTLLIRDVTRLRNLETSYEALSREVEQRIHKRTEELHNTAERYRTIVEHQPDFIVRWKPDGTRTFVNEAYCRYWGISEEQALARNFLFHSGPEDRPAVEQNIAHLYSSAHDVETEICRMIKPDGKIVWQEWTDKAVRDEWGNLIAIQSSGRDITERKLAEESPQGKI